MGICADQCDDYRTAQNLCVSDTDSQTRDDCFFNHEYQQQPEHRVCISQRVTFQMLPLRCAQTLCVTISYSQNQQSQRGLRTDNLLNNNANFEFVQRHSMRINFPRFVKNSHAPERRLSHRRIAERLFYGLREVTHGLGTLFHELQFSG